MQGTRRTMILLLCTLTAGGCVVASSPAAVSPPRVAVLGNGRPAAQYGTDAAQVFEHPALRAKVRALFGPDWSSSKESGLSASAPAYFARSSAPTELRIDGADWIAVRGCVPEACSTRHGLLLIGPGAERLLARIDDGGFTREYGYGPGMVTFRPQDRAVVDAAWQALGGQAASVGLGVPEHAVRLAGAGLNAAS